MSQAPKFGEYRIVGTTPDGDCNAMLTLSTDCLVCGDAVTGPCLSCGPPYFGLLHEACAHRFAFDGRYPHRFAISVMMSGRAQEVARTNGQTR